VKAIEIVFLLPNGKKHARQFKTEEEAAEYLKTTHATEAPISIRYVNGSSVARHTLERIYGPAFETIQTHALADSAPVDARAVETEDRQQDSAGERPSGGFGHARNS